MVDLEKDLRIAIPPKDEDHFLSKLLENVEAKPPEKNVLCPKCNTAFLSEENNEHFTCSSCSQSFSIDKGKAKKQNVENTIQQAIRDLDIQNSENLQISVKSYQFKTKIEPWIISEETKAENDVEFLLRDGSFSFPACFNLPQLSVTNDEILEVVQNLNFILHIWQSNLITPFIFGVQSDSRRIQSIHKVTGLLEFLFGVYHTSRASGLSEIAQSKEYSSALAHFRAAKQSLEEIRSLLTPFLKSILSSTGFSIDLCQIAESSFRSPDNNRGAFIKYEEKLRKGCEWDQRMADNCERLSGREPQRPPKLFPWQRNQEQSIIFEGFPFLDLIRVPGGEFFMGANASFQPKTLQNDWASKPDGDPITIEDYLISKYPVTVGQFAAFIRDNKFQTTAESANKGMVFSANGWKLTTGACWMHPQGPESSIRQKLRHPVTLVSFSDAQEFCKWLSKKTNKKVVLPSEAQWEKAARGPDKRIYPWGIEPPNKERCNYLNHWKDTKPVGYYSRSPLEIRPTFLWGTSKFINQDSPYGCCDLAGNVWEWTRSIFKLYPYRPNDGRENPEALGPRVIRGGAFDSTASELRTFTRRKMYPDQAYGNLGFRIVVLEK